MNKLVGQPMDRVDGRLKVTGAAQYSAEFLIKDLVYAVTVQSTIARGKIRSIQSLKAESAPGVLAILTSKNAPRLKRPPEGVESSNIKFGEKDLLPLQDQSVHYDGQHIAVVIARTFEQAEYAATLLGIEYDEESAVLGFPPDQARLHEPEHSMGRPLQVKRGEVDPAWREAPVKIDHTYTTPVYHHNPMEPHATIAVWAGDNLTLYDSTQAVLGNRDAVAATLGLDPTQVRVISLFVGGGFGCKGFTWAHSLLAPMAARAVGRPVKLVLNRQQMFTCNGRRAPTIQRIALGAETNGKLVSIEHQTLSETSFVDEFVETAGLATQRLYECPNVRIGHKLVRLNRGTPGPARAPGEAPGTFAIESALDELAYELGMDPIEVRLVNYAEKDPQTGLPWSSKNLKECYQRGAEAIGWSKRNARPGSLREGRLLVGYGMATSIYPANRVPASARVQIRADGRAIASSCTQDIGTGTYTVMSQIAADELGLPLHRVTFKLGDSALPKGPVSGGSQTAASVGPAVKEAAIAARHKLLHLAISDNNSPLFGTNPGDIMVEEGRCFSRDQPDKSETYANILKRARIDFVEAEITTNGTTRATGGKKKPGESAEATKNLDLELDASRHSFQSFGAQFARVLYDPALGTVRATHCASVMDIGKVLNLKTARNQIMGGMIFGIGMALMEGTTYDETRGRIVTRDLANYLLPVHADIPELTVQFIDRPDPHLNSIGARGVGEIGITGITAAIANAVYHASGKRIRDLPITPDKLI